MNLEAITLHSQKDFLNQHLLGGRIDKIYQPNRLDLVLQIRNKQNNYLLYITCSSNAPHVRISNKQFENPDNPPSFCMLLRKHLESGRIVQISQPNLDRNIILDIDTIGQGRSIITKRLIIELAGKSSNIILVNEENIILDSIKHIGANMSQFRQILPAKPYMPPPPQTGLNILTTKTADIINLILQSPQPLLKALIASTVGIGPLAAKEIIWRSGLPNDIISNSLDQHDTNSLKDAIESIINPIKTGEETFFVAINEENKILALTPFEPEHLRNIELKTFDNINDAIEFAQNIKPNKPQENIQLSKYIKNEISRIQKKLIVLDEELKNATNSDYFRNIADNLMSQLHILTKGMPKCTIIDLYTNEKITIDLQENLEPIENAQHYYKLYNKAKRAVEHLENQIVESKNLLEYLSSIEFSLQNIQTKSELAEIKTELTSIGLIKEKKATNIKQAPSVPIKLSLQSGATIYVGKNNKQNDQVTFKIGRTNDLWFHTKNIPGSHVILQSQDKQVQENDLKKAATLSAWFSKARGSSNVPVDYTERKNVKKPSGAKPGFVIYEKQHTIQVTTTEEEINKILQENNHK